MYVTPTVRFKGLIAIIIGLSCAQMFLAQTPRGDRIVRQIRGSGKSVARGNTHALARPEFDQGRVDNAMSMERVTMAFKSTASQEAALQQLLKAQADPNSPNYQKWLSPEQFADRFGLSNKDFENVRSWLKSEGFTIVDEARSRRAISFSGTAAQMQATFSTEIHNYRANNRSFYANASDPVIPSAISDVVLGFRNLNNLRPQSRARARKVDPRFTSAISRNHFLSPDDFATIYDLKSLYAAGIDGTGQRIVIAGQTDILMKDISTFRSVSGLSVNPPQVVRVPGSPDPGVVPGDITEADLDLEWSGAVARNATLIYVNSYFGAFDSFQYAIDQDLAPVISISYGDCETDWEQSDRDSLLAITEQANAEGITLVSAAGDSGAADCDYSPDGSPLPFASLGLAIDLPAGLPTVTGLGGTGFNEGGSSALYWSSNNNAVNGSALSYIPEAAWNDTAAAGTLEGGGGGRSVFYSKPAWQTGTGVPNDSARDVPDISLNASPENDGYLTCSENSCLNNSYRDASGNLNVVGGTSAGAPAFAGVVALINQKLGHSQGNVNPQLYQLAATTPAAFHDVTTGGNQVPCVAGTPNCVNGSLGYSAGAGYDLATGLGSLDIFNLVVAWGADQYFATVDRGGYLATTNDVSNNLTVGYATIQTLAGQASPSGIAIYGYRSNGILVSEAGVPASPAILGARIYAEVAGAVDTGVAIANPNSQPATISFYFTDPTGASVGTPGAFTIPANGQIAKFLDQPPFSLGVPGFLGTFTLSSNVPVSIVALRGRTNERGDFIITTLPIVDMSVAPVSTTQVLADFADGGGWTTQVCLVNPSDAAMTGKVQFVSSAGAPLNTVAYSIAGRSSARVATPGTAGSAQSGYVLVIPDSGNNAPSSLAVFSLVQGGVTVTEAGVQPTTGSALRVFAETSGTFPNSGSIQSGLAIANTSAVDVTLSFDLRALDGTSLATGTVAVPKNQQISKFLYEILGPLPNLKGVLRITSSGSGVSVVGLRERYNERGDFLITTTPATNEAAPPTTGPLYFPHFAMGGGYTTEFILYGGTPGQAPSGYLIFTNPDGTPLTISFN